MIRREFLKTAGTAALAGMIAFSPMAAAAGSSEPAVRPASVEEVQVPMRDVRGVNPEFLIVAAAEVSNDSILVIFYGQDRDAFYAVREATREAIFEGYPVKGMFIAKGESAVQIYADAQLFSSIPKPGANIGPATKSEIMGAYENVIKPRQQAAIQPPTLAAN